MYETETFPERRTPVEAADSYQMLVMLTSDVVFDHEVERLKTEIEIDPDLQGIQTLQQQLNGVGPARNLDEIKVIQAFEAQLEMYPKEKRTHYRNVEDLLHWFEKRATRRVTSDSFEATQIMEAINQAPQIQPTPASKPPFADYRKNTPEAWGYVPDSDIDEYLEGRRFNYSLASISGLTTDANGNPKNRIDITAYGSDVEPLEIPIDLMVYAAGFNSWRGRSGQGSYKDVSGQYSRDYDRKIHSSDLIKHYASLPSELPPVEHVVVYVQPDGVMFADNSGGDSHRIGAAILRGQQTIKANSVTVIPIDRYIMKPNTPRYT